MKTARLTAVIYIAQGHMLLSNNAEIQTQVFLSLPNLLYCAKLTWRLLLLLYCAKYCAKIIIIIVLC